jgi:hypothetical protein
MAPRSQVSCAPTGVLGAVVATKAGGADAVLSVAPVDVCPFWIVALLHPATARKRATPNEEYKARRSLIAAP